VARSTSALAEERRQFARPATYLCRAAAARLRALVTNNTPEREAKAMFDDDAVTDIVLRAASSPAAISGTGG